MYRHDQEQINRWLEVSGFCLERELRFAVYVDREKSMPLPTKVYLARKGQRI
jgi:hypothetical protein